jgi:hypothetical protein
MFLVFKKQAANRPSWSLWLAGQSAHSLPVMKLLVGVPLE